MGTMSSPKKELTSSFMKVMCWLYGPRWLAVNALYSACSMQSEYPQHFDRDMACTEAEWLMWLPRAVGDHPLQLLSSEAQVQIGSGSLGLHWKVLAQRSIGAIRLPRLQVCFRFQGLDDSQRMAFMKRFDLYTQRGGG